jgi:hypothetical protein
MNKFVDVRPLADPLAAAQKLIEIGKHGRDRAGRADLYRADHGPFSTSTAAARPNMAPASRLAIDRGCLWKHESGTYVKLTQAGADHGNCADSIKSLAMI